MTKKARTILFFACLLLFAIMAPAVVFYAQGYRVDFSQMKITQTGGLYFKTVPKQAEIYLDGKLKKKTDFFFGSALIENLLPKKYEIEIKKDGYNLWKKTLEVKEKEVTEAKNVILFAENIQLTSLLKNVNAFWFSSDEQKIILKEDGQDGWELKLFNIAKNLKSYLVNEKDINLNGAEFFSLEFSADSKLVYLEAGVNEEIKNYVINLSDNSPYPKEYEKKGTPSNVIVLQKNNNEVYYLSNTGFIFKADLSFENKTKITETALPIKNETAYALKILEDNIFLKEGKTLYKYNSGEKTFETISEDVNEFTIAPDSSKIAHFSNNELWIYFLKKGERNEPGDKVLLFRLSENIGDVSWINSTHLIYTIGDKIKITEIDNRDIINTIIIAENKNRQIFWSGENKTLYLLNENGNLSFTDTIIP